MTKLINVKGLEQWKALEGKRVGFEFNLGWGDFTYVGMEVKGALRDYNEFDMEQVLVLGPNGGGYVFYETETTEVEILD